METGVDQLTEALWGQSTAYAKNLIQKSVSGLRACCNADTADGPGAEIAWSGSGYRLDTGDADVDLYAYERLAVAGLAAARDGDLSAPPTCSNRPAPCRPGRWWRGTRRPMMERSGSSARSGS